MTHPSCARSGGPDPAEGADAKSGLVPTWGVQRRPHCRPKCRMGPCPRRNGILSPLPGGRGPSSVSAFDNTGGDAPSRGGLGCREGHCLPPMVGASPGPRAKRAHVSGCQPHSHLLPCLFPHSVQTAGSQHPAILLKVRPSQPPAPAHVWTPGYPHAPVLPSAGLEQPGSHRDLKQHASVCDSAGASPQPLGAGSLPGRGGWRGAGGERQGAADPGRPAQPLDSMGSSGARTRSLSAGRSSFCSPANPPLVWVIRGGACPRGSQWRPSRLCLQPPQQPSGQMGHLF